jgi:hypothetical protein
MSASKRAQASIAARIAEWAPAVVLALLVLAAPWVVLAPLMIPARPEGLDLPVLMGALIVSVPWVLMALLTRRAVRRRRGRRGPAVAARTGIGASRHRTRRDQRPDVPIWRTGRRGSGGGVQPGDPPD